MRESPRPRRAVSPALLVLLTPVFRYSHGRGAYVLRVIGGRVGPVLVPRHDASTPRMPEGSSG